MKRSIIFAVLSIIIAMLTLHTTSGQMSGPMPDGAAGGLAPHATPHGLAVNDALNSAHELAEMFGADGYMLIPEGATVSQGMMIDPFAGVILVAGDVVPASGTFWSPDDLVIDFQGDCGLVELDGHMVLGVVSQGTLSSSGISVECDSGYFACCFCNDHGCPVARCRRNSGNVSDNDCQAGGRGSSRCSIDRGAC